MPREKKSSPAAKKPTPSSPSKSKSSSSSESSKVSPHPPSTAQPAPKRKFFYINTQVFIEVILEPGLLAQAASTAGGVAVGSSIGHAVGNMISGGSKTSAEKSSAVSGPAPSCKNEIEQLMDCINRQPELNACQNFFETLKQCKASKAPQQ